MEKVRHEEPRDREHVRQVNEAAFGRPDEADLIDQLRTEGAILLSLVAEMNGEVIGHILFSRMTIETARDEVKSTVEAVALAPMAVLPRAQNKQVGSRLVRHGLAELQKQGEAIVIVLGHSHYYRRFGFSTDSARHLDSPFPKDAYMALELRSGALAGVKGAVKYPAAFGLRAAPRGC